MNEFTIQMNGGIGSAGEASERLIDSRPTSVPLRGLFYAQFHNTVGPQFIHVVPKDLLSESTMERVANYVLPKNELSGSLVTVRGVAQLKLMSCPLFVDHKRYDRHRFTFAFGMIFGQDDDVGPYGPVLRKISRFFKKLETDHQFLTISGPDSKCGQLLARVMEGLVDRGECIVRVMDAKTSLALKLFPKLLDPPPVGDFQVPVFIRSLKNVMVKDWDLTIQRLEQHIDGRMFVKRIAIESQIDISLVRRALRQLLYYRVIVMLDVFQYSNRYACTRKLADLASNEDIQQECRQYVSRDARNPVAFSKIFALYASLHPSAPFGDFCIEHKTESLGIDDPRLVTFGLRTGIIRRVKHIPVALTIPLAIPTNPASKGSGDTQSAQIRSLVDCERSFDELCGMTTFSFSEVDLMFDAMDDVVVVRM